MKTCARESSSSGGFFDVAAGREELKRIETGLFAGFLERSGSRAKAFAKTELSWRRRSSARNSLKRRLPTQACSLNLPKKTKNL